MADANAVETVRPAFPIRVWFRSWEDGEIAGPLLDELSDIGGAVEVMRLDESGDNPLGVVVSLGNVAQLDEVHEAAGRWVTAPWTPAETLERAVVILTPHSHLLEMVWIDEAQLASRLPALVAGDAEVWG